VAELTAKSPRAAERMNDGQRYQRPCQATFMTSWAGTWETDSWVSGYADS